MNRSGKSCDRLKTWDGGREIGWRTGDGMADGRRDGDGRWDGGQETFYVCVCPSNTEVRKQTNSILLLSKMIEKPQNYMYSHYKRKKLIVQVQSTWFEPVLRTTKHSLLKLPFIKVMFLYL